MTTILLARHGETDWNREGRWQGHAPTRLNETGRRQARALSERLAGTQLDAIYSSDLPRALETASIVADSLGMRPFAEPGLREIDVGSREGRTAAEIYGLQWDGESHEAHRARVHAAVRRIAGRHAGGRVLAVTHGGSLRRLQEIVLGEPLDVVENCATWGIVLRGQTFVPLD